MVVLMAAAAHYLTHEPNMESPWRQLLRAHFNQHADRVAAAKAQRTNAALAAGAFELVNQRDQNAGAAGANRVAKRNAAAANIQLFMRDT